MQELGSVRALYSARGPNSNPPCGVALVVCLVPVSECEVVCGGGGVEQNEEKIDQRTMKHDETK